MGSAFRRDRRTRMDRNGRRQEDADFAEIVGLSNISVVDQTIRLVIRSIGLVRSKRVRTDAKRNVSLAITSRTFAWNRRNRMFTAA